jgi:hypothetical protein
VLRCWELLRSFPPRPEPLRGEPWRPACVMTRPSMCFGRQRCPRTTLASRADFVCPDKKPDKTC